MISHASTYACQDSQQQSPHEGADIVFLALDDLGGQFKTDNLWTLTTDNVRAAETSEFYFAVSSERKSVWTFVRQLFGPHLSTWA